MLITVLVLPYIVQCGGGAEHSDQLAVNYPEQSEEDAAFFAAPTEYGYSLKVVEGEGKPYVSLNYRNDESEVLRLPAGSDEPVAFNYWNGFVYHGEMIGGSIEEGGVCSIEVFDENNGENHILCVVETEPAEKLYGQVIAAAGLVFIAAETDHGEVKELFVSCFDIETGEDLAEWTGVGENIEFAGGCGTATPETVFFQISEGFDFTLYTRNGRAFEDIYTGLYGQFDSEAGYWLFAEEILPDEEFTRKFDNSDVDLTSLLPGSSDNTPNRGFPVYYSYGLRDREVNPLLLSRDTGGDAAENLIDGDPATVWITDGDVKAEVRIGFGAPLRAESMYILPCYPDPDDFEKYSRIKRIRTETSSGFYAEIEFPDEMRLQDVPLIAEGETPPKINWAAVSVLEVYEDEGNGETCIAEISFDIR